MNRIKTKYNALSKNERIVALLITTVLAVIAIALVYNAGVATGSTLYNWTH